MLATYSMHVMSPISFPFFSEETDFRLLLMTLHIRTPMVVLPTPLPFWGGCCFFSYLPD